MKNLILIIFAAILTSCHIEVEPLSFTILVKELEVNILKAEYANQNLEPFPSDQVYISMEEFEIGRMKKQLDEYNRNQFAEWIIKTH